MARWLDGPCNVQFISAYDQKHNVAWSSKLICNEQPSQRFPSERKGGPEEDMEAAFEEDTKFIVTGKDVNEKKKKVTEARNAKEKAMKVPQDSKTDGKVTGATIRWNQNRKREEGLKWVLNKKLSKIGNCTAIVADDGEDGGVAGFFQTGGGAFTWTSLSNARDMFVEVHS
ncbi:MAG: hypothetical protein Q9213_005534 [Squamulea squamosa]